MLELRVGADHWPTLPANKTVSQWKDLENHGFKVRSRALTNTLYARLFVGDLFIHGIGGAKYDELTDEISRRFFGVAPPEYLVLSATKLLPVPRYPVHIADVQRLTRRVRDLKCNPQRFVQEDEVRELVAEKQSWITRQPEGARARRERFEALRRVTQSLRPHVFSQWYAAKRDLDLCKQQLQANAVLNRRDYAFCLFPEGELRPFVTQFQ
jgi:hypothetical protein